MKSTFLKNVGTFMKNVGRSLQKNVGRSLRKKLEEASRKMLAALPKNVDEKKCSQHFIENVGITSKNFDEKMLTPLRKNVGKLLKNVDEKMLATLTKKCWNTFEKC
jgi:hypothetical protein